MLSWIIYALISAFSFAIGDVIVVKGSSNTDPYTLFIVYTIIMGLCCLIYFMLHPYNREIINKFGMSNWNIVILISIMYLIAYTTHFKALSTAPNPGYANSLVMFHVILLSLGSYYFLHKPLNMYTIIGIIMMFIGGILVTVYSQV